MRIVRSSLSWHLLRHPTAPPACLRLLALDHGYRVGAISASLGCSERHLHAIFTRDVGMPPKAWLRQDRLLIARNRLREGCLVERVSDELGFSCVNSFRRDFRSCYGVSPRTYQTHVKPAGIERNVFKIREEKK